ncbi:protein-disulfide reductase DsbD [Castellaniella sp. S9]|uniref:protein-disulfide reductase DsbD n=1 Tax=Castellaniella sp. S9 TaxID=2993652 RepID=UPI0022B37DC2|nr:protein-disulfide reductase DsbD [Castellaniella sp. S9]
MNPHASPKAAPLKTLDVIAPAPSHAGRRIWTLLAVVLLGLAAWLSLPRPAQAEADFLDPAIAFVPAAAMHDPLTLDVHYRIAPAYYMYRERFEVRIRAADGRTLMFMPSALTLPEDVAAAGKPAWAAGPALPGGTVKYDPTFDRDMEVYHGGVTLRLPLQAGEAGPLAVEITGQGCADAGLCYPPMTQDLVLEATDGGYRAVGAQVTDRVPPPRDEVSGGPDAGVAAGAASVPAANSVFDLGDTGMAAWLAQAGLGSILLFSLLFGVLLSFTPCVLPMVPILLAMIAGTGQSPSRLRGLGLAACYVLGMSLVYTALGVAAGLLGAGLAAWLQSPWVLGTFAVLLALFGLAMLDVFTLQAPVGLQSALQARAARMPGGQAGGVFLTGMVSALIVGPCVAAPLAGILLFISQTGDVVVGGASLFAMAWGEGLLLLAVGAGAGALLPRAGAWMDQIKAGFGVLLLATAWWMARPLVPGALYMAGWSLLALWAAMMLWRAGRGDGAGLRLAVRALAALLALWAAAQFMGLLAGGRDMLRPLAPFAAGSGAAGGGAVDLDAIRARFTRIASAADLEARLAAADRPVMLDFYADWCVSCIEMEKFTFSDPEVARRMSGVLLLQADVTRMTAQDRELLARFDLFGPPGIIFFDAHGRVLPDARVIGFKKAAEFSAVLDRVLVTAPDR